MAPRTSLIPDLALRFFEKPARTPEVAPRTEGIAKGNRNVGPPKPELKGAHVEEAAQKAFGIGTKGLQALGEEKLGSLPPIERKPGEAPLDPETRPTLEEIPKGYPEALMRLTDRIDDALKARFPKVAAAGEKYSLSRVLLGKGKPDGDATPLHYAVGGAIGATSLDILGQITNFSEPLGLLGDVAVGGAFALGLRFVPTNAIGHSMGDNGVLEFLKLSFLRHHVKPSEVGGQSIARHLYGAKEMLPVLGGGAAALHALGSPELLGQTLIAFGLGMTLNAGLAETVHTYAHRADFRFSKDPRTQQFVEAYRAEADPTKRLKLIKDFVPHALYNLPDALAVELREGGYLIGKDRWAGHGAHHAGTVKGLAEGEKPISASGAYEIIWGPNGGPDWNAILDDSKFTRALDVMLSRYLLPDRWAPEWAKMESNNKTNHAGDFARRIWETWKSYDGKERDDRLQAIRLERLGENIEDSLATIDSYRAQAEKLAQELKLSEPGRREALEKEAGTGSNTDEVKAFRQYGALLSRADSLTQELPVVRLQYYALSQPDAVATLRQEQAGLQSELARLQATAQRTASVSWSEGGVEKPPAASAESVTLQAELERVQAELRARELLVGWMSRVVDFTPDWYSRAARP